MKRIVMLLGNIAIVLFILGLTLFYVSNEHKRMYSVQAEEFQNMTVAMESVTTNYVLGEQQVCKSWANYINSGDMTAEEAMVYLRRTIAAPEVSAHILFMGDDELSGLSTASRSEGNDDYTVSYKNVSAFDGGVDTFLNE